MRNRVSALVISPERVKSDCWRNSAVLPSPVSDFLMSPIVISCISKYPGGCAVLKDITASPEILRLSWWPILSFLLDFYVFLSFDYDHTGVSL